MYATGLALAMFVMFVVVERKRAADSQNSASPADSALLVRDHSPIKGAKDAKVTVVEFLDPECEACRAMHSTVKSLLSEYDGKIRLVIRYMPFHRNSRYAASALEEAREAGKFDQALDLLFKMQPEWGDHHRPRPELIPFYLKQFGMEESKLNVFYLVSKFKERMDIDHADGKRLGVKATPTFFVNGKKLHSIGYEPLKAAIDEALRSR